MLNKQAININFGKGVDTKTDPFQLTPGQFLSMQNSIFDKAGQLTKRNGYGALTVLPDSSSTYITTFNNNLTAIGTQLYAYSAPSQMWYNKGNLQPINLTTLPLVRNNTSQTQADSVTATNGLVCVSYTDQNPANLSTNVHKYAVLDSTTGQYIINPTLLTNADPVYGTPRVFLLGNYFIVLYTTNNAGEELQYIAISINNPSIISTPTVIGTYTPSASLNFDGVVVNNKLYIAYNTVAGGQAVKVTYITQTLNNPVTPANYSGQIGTMFSVTADNSNTSKPIIWVSYYDSASVTAHTLAVDENLNPILAPTSFDSGTPLANITSIADSGELFLYNEVINAYAYDTSIETNFIASVSVTQTGTVSSVVIGVRSVGLASKAFIYNDQVYFLAVYNSTFQPGYFLINESGQVVAKLAYTNAGGYNTFGLPNVTVIDDQIQVVYLYKDLIQAVNKTQGLANAAGVYSQTGVNLVTFDMDVSNVTSTEIGNALNLTGGFMATYDGVAPVEQGFFVYPDYVEAIPSAVAGNMSAQTYFYQVTYEWADNNGNIIRSAPSIPVEVGLSGNTSVQLDIPTLRLTYKIASPVRIVIYRWSTAQQSYYRTTSILLPILNDPTVDYVQYIDTNSDASILGNDLIYTTGGVIEDISPPSSSIQCLFNNRLWLVDAEDTNLLWFSKQVIEGTPVEMSDLLTQYIAPTTASQGSTGPITALAPMDDKLIIFKANALGYLNGIGPDNTGSNNQYSDFILINSVVGCINQQSIVFMPQGLMFQSSKGIWLLGRDLSTTYIGAPVEAYTTGANVNSAINVPETNQVRFTLDTGITLMYDYYYAQWGTFSNVPAISSTIYNNLHTYINELGQVFQETPNLYLDNSNPVLMQFTSAWINLEGLQGFERFYQLMFLGVYLTPFKLQVQLAYNYQSNAIQSTIVTPDNQSPTWGSSNLWGGGATWGGTQLSGPEAVSNIFEARVFPVKQKCESFQIAVSEVFDQSEGISAGAGLTLSGMNLLVGMKKGTRTTRTGRSFG